MNKKRIRILLAIGALLIPIAIGLINQNTRNKALENHDLVVATITDMYKSSALEIVRVKFNYKNKLFAGSFGIAEWDSLAINDKIRIIVSKQHPANYIRYIGVEK